MFKLDDALKALDGREEFIVKRYEHCLVVIDYVVAFKDSFDGIRNNFRGIVFDERNGEIVSLPLHKFYNVNQTEDTQLHKLLNCTANVYEKLDGSMIHFFVNPHTNELCASTRKSVHTPQAIAALKFAKENHLSEKIQDLVEDGWTPIFEYVSKSNLIVVEYNRPRLVYLLSRNRKTGEYKFHENFADSAEKYSFSFKDLQSHLDKEHFEGYVCHLDNGQIVKAKTKWYLDRHRAVDYLMRPKYKLYEAVFDGVLDDIMQMAHPDQRKIFEDIIIEVQSDWLNEHNRLEALCKKIVLSMVSLQICGGIITDSNKLFFELASVYKNDVKFLLALYKEKDNDFRKIMRKKLSAKYRDLYPDKPNAFNCE